MTNFRERLRAAYEATDYLFSAGPRGPFVIRCGATSAEVDALLAATGHDHWAYVTACNPRSERLSAAANAERMARLGTLVRDRGLPHFAGAGIASGGDWPPEQSLLILGITTAEAAELGRSFEQFAIVVGRRGEPARLMWIDPETAT